MKTTNNYNPFYLLLVFASAVSFSQEVKNTSEIEKNNRDLFSVNTDHYFTENQTDQNIIFIFNENEYDNLEYFSSMKSVKNVLKTKHDTAKNSISNIR